MSRKKTIQPLTTQDATHHHSEYNDLVEREPTKNVRQSWTPRSVDFSRLSYREIDPDSITPDSVTGAGREALADNKMYRGVVRQINTALNSPNPDNELDLDAITRVGTQFSINGDSNVYTVVKMPLVRSGEIFAVVEDERGIVSEMDAVMLGVCANRETSQYAQTVCKRIRKGKHGRANVQVEFGLTKFKL